MASIRSILTRNTSELLLISIMLLFSLQLFSDFIEFTYILCLMTLSLNENVLTVLFLFSPVILMLFNKNIPNKFILLAGIFMVLSRVVEPLFFDTQLRMITSGFGVGCFMIFFPAFLINSNKTQGEESSELLFGIGLALALLFSIFFRTLNSTIDISTYSWFQAIGWVMAILAIGLLFQWYQNQEKSVVNNDITESTEDSNNFSKKRLLGLTCGIMSILFLINFAFSSPGVISRWTEGNYFLIIVLLVTVLIVTTFVFFHSPELMSRITPSILWIWNTLFVLTLVVTLIVNQVPFPTNIGYFPILAPTTTIFHHLLVLLLIMLLPIIIIDFILLTREFMNLTPKPSSRTLGGVFTIGSGIYLLAMIFALLFTSTWGFIPIIGTLFRDLFWFIFLLVGLVLVSSLSNLKNKSLQFSTPSFNSKTRIISISLLVVIFLGTLGSIIVLEPHPATSSNPSSLKILNYNIQQGVNDRANKNYDGQLDLIREIDADIIGLQECSKIAGSSDVVRYFAEKLNMYSYFGPKWITGTTGVAVLSKYPIKNATTLYHFSENVDRKQTATTECQIEVGNHIYTVYNTHTYGRLSAKEILQTDIVNRVDGKSNVIFIGDFNFKPFTSPYNLTTEVLNDSWWVRWPTGQDNLGYNNSRDIELIFVSPDISVTDCQFVLDPTGSISDHPAYWVIIQL